MGDSSQASASILGFLTVVENDLLGLVGGYLLLSPAGRPLEFHCTAPVKPSRAQQILFGPTLKPYLIGEQISQALIRKADAQPLVIWTDEPAVLAARDFVTLPMALVVGNGASVEDAVRHFDRLTEFVVGKQRAAVVSLHANDVDVIVSRLAALATFDLAEPFGRIREAIEEAQRAVGNRQAA